MRNIFNYTDRKDDIRKTGDNPEIKIDVIEKDGVTEYEPQIKIDLNRKLPKDSRVLIVEDVITTGKSSLECFKLIKKCKAKLVGFACIIDRSSKTKIKNKIISQVKLKIPTYSKNELPSFIKNKPVTKPGSRFLK